MRSNLPKVGSPETPDTASDHLARARSFSRVKYSILRNVGDELFSPWNNSSIIDVLFDTALCCLARTLNGIARLTSGRVAENYGTKRDDRKP